MEESLISPNTITVDLVDIDQHLKPTDVQQLQEIQQQRSSLEDLAAFEGDPLEWLIETGVAEEGDDKQNAWLPESSLPFFPELNKDTVVGQQPTSVEPTSHRLVGETDRASETVASTQVTAASETMVEEAINKNMVDPNVTVQSLFLPDEADDVFP